MVTAGDIWEGLKKEKTSAGAREKVISTIKDKKVTKWATTGAGGRAYRSAGAKYREAQDRLLRERQVQQAVRQSAYFVEGSRPFYTAVFYDPVTKQEVQGEVTVQQVGEGDPRETIRQKLISEGKLSTKEATQQYFKQEREAELRAKAGQEQPKKALKTGDTFVSQTGKRVTVKEAPQLGSGQTMFEKAQAQRARGLSVGSKFTTPTGKTVVVKSSSLSPAGTSYEQKVAQQRAERGITPPVTELSISGLSVSEPSNKPFAKPIPEGVKTTKVMNLDTLRANYAIPEDIGQYVQTGKPIRKTSKVITGIAGGRAGWFDRTTGLTKTYTKTESIVPFKTGLVETTTISRVGKEGVGAKFTSNVSSEFARLNYNISKPIRGFGEAFDKTFIPEESLRAKKREFFQEAERLGVDKTSYDYKNARRDYLKSVGRVKAGRDFVVGNVKFFTEKPVTALATFGSGKVASGIIKGASKGSTFLFSKLATEGTRKGTVFLGKAGLRYGGKAGTGVMTGAGGYLTYKEVKALSSLPSDERYKKAGESFATFGVFGMGLARGLRSKPDVITEGARVRTDYIQLGESTGTGSPRARATKIIEASGKAPTISKGDITVRGTRTQSGKFIAKTKMDFLKGTSSSVETSGVGKRFQTITKTTTAGDQFTSTTYVKGKLRTVKTGTKKGKFKGLEFPEVTFSKARSETALTEFSPAQAGEAGLKTSYVMSSAEGKGAGVSWLSDTKGVTIKGKGKNVDLATELTVIERGSPAFETFAKELGGEAKAYTALEARTGRFDFKLGNINKPYPLGQKVTGFSQRVGQGVSTRATRGAEVFSKMLQSKRGGFSTTGTRGSNRFIENPFETGFPEPRVTTQPKPKTPSITKVEPRVTTGSKLPKAPFSGRKLFINIKPTPRGELNFGAFGIVPTTPSSVTSKSSLLARNVFSAKPVNEFISRTDPIENIISPTQDISATTSTTYTPVDYTPYYDTTTNITFNEFTTPTPTFITGGGLFFPTLGGGGRSRKKKSKKADRGYQYAPSLIAVALGITKKGKAPSGKTAFTGFEIRPVIVSNKKRKGWFI